MRVLVEAEVREIRRALTFAADLYGAARDRALPALRALERLEAELVAQREVVAAARERVEYECAHAHRWWMSPGSRSTPTRCPICGTSSFGAAVPEAEEGDELEESRQRQIEADARLFAPEAEETPQ